MESMVDERMMGNLNIISNSVESVENPFNQCIIDQSSFSIFLFDDHKFVDHDHQLNLIYSTILIYVQRVVVIKKTRTPLFFNFIFQFKMP